MQKTINLNGKDYVLAQTLERRRTITLQIRPNLQLLVKAPLRTPQSYIDSFVNSKKLWLYKKLQELQQNQAQKTTVSYLPGDKFHYLGQQLTLEVGTQLHLQGGVEFPPAENIAIIGDKIVLQSPFEPENKLHNQLELKKFFLRQANQILRERYAAVAAQIGLQDPPQLVINNTRSKWGSCKTHGPIALSQKLIHASLGAIDAVIMHEFCHLWHKNHGPRFYARLLQLCPLYKKYDLELKKINPHIVI